jgi:transcriptional regulator with XRE-family HTH domain
VDLNIGEKIKRLRLASELTQHELADRARLTKGFISQLENDQSSIGVDTLSDILDALGITLAEFFSDSAEEQIVFGPSDRVAIEGTGAERFELLIAGSTNNLMDPIMILLRPGQQLKKQPSQPGEQFGFVLKGTATLTVARKQWIIRNGHCFHLKSDRPHQISNQGKADMFLLWITSPPLM